MSVPETPTANLPTADDLRHWRRERDRLVAEERAIKRRRAKLDKLIEAGVAFVGYGAKTEEAPNTPPSVEQKPPTFQTKMSRSRKPRRPRSKSWVATILRIAKKENRGMTYPELKGELAKTHLGETLQRTDKAFYGGIGKLAERGAIVKHKGRVYTPAAYKRFKLDVEAGLVDDAPAPSSFSGHNSPNKLAVFELLSNRPSGVGMGEIIECLLNNTATRNAVVHNRTPVYNLLGRMTKRGELNKRGRKYYLPVTKVETPNSEESGAPKHHGDRSGTPSSPGNGEFGLSAAPPGADPADSGP